MPETINDATQGEVLISVAAHAGLEPALIGYFEGVGAFLGTLVQAGEKMVEDGLGLEEFIKLLKGEDI